MALSLNEVLAKATLETVDMLSKGTLQKDATTTGYTVGTGLTGIPLEAPAKQLVPFLSPFRNRVKRVNATQAGKRVTWRAITNVNAGNASPSTGFGYAGAVLQTTEQDFSAPFQLMAQGDTVMLDAERMAKGFDNIRARSGVNTLYSLMQSEDIMLLGGQQFTLGTPATPVLAPATTGGQIGAVNVGVQVAARTMQGFYYINPNTNANYITQASAQATTGALTGTTNKVTATVASLPGAVVYDWYVGLAGGTLYYYASTTTTSCTITSVPSSAAAANIQGQATPARFIAPSANPPGADTSGDSNAINGFISTLIGSFNPGSGGVLEQNGVGNPTGATLIDNRGGTMTGNNGTINEIDNLLYTVYNNSRVSPDLILMSTLDHYNASNKIINSGGAYTLFRPDQLSERQKTIGGAYVETYLNKYVDGQPIPMMSHPWLPQGTVLAITERVPYPNSEISNTLEVEVIEDYNQFEYGVSRTANSATGGPRYDYDVRVNEAFKNYAPVAMGIMYNVANG